MGSTSEQRQITAPAPILVFKCAAPEKTSSSLGSFVPRRVLGPGAFFDLDGIRRAAFP